MAIIILINDSIWVVLETRYIINQMHLSDTRHTPSSYLEQTILEDANRRRSVQLFPALAILICAGACSPVLYLYSDRTIPRFVWPFFRLPWNRDFTMLYLLSLAPQTVCRMRSAERRHYRSTKTLYINTRIYIPARAVWRGSDGLMHRRTNRKAVDDIALLLESLSNPLCRAAIIITQWA